MCRRLNSLISFLLVLALCSTAAADLAGWEAAISGAGPLNWYKFDETGAECIDWGSGGLNGTYDSVSLGQEGRFGPTTAAGFERIGANRVNFTGATGLAGPWTVEYIVKTTKEPAANDSQALHDSDTTSIRLAGWTALGEAGFTLYGVADYRFTPAAGLTLNDLIIQPNVWMHLVWRNNGSGTQLFFDGVLVGTSTDMIELPRLRIGGRGAGPADHLQGVLDEAVVFDRALTDDEIFAHASTTFPLEATNPVPENGTIHEDTWVNLSWTAGSTAASHDVYLGDNFENVNNATVDSPEFRGNQAGTFIVAGFPGFPYPEGLVPGTTYYWRIDEVEADGVTKHKGNVWSFSIPPRTAYNPNPADGAEFVAIDSKLNWIAGFGAKLHTVYFGTDFDSVSSAAGGLPVGATTYNPGPLQEETVYYWRVDEFDALVTHKGDVWGFTTPGAAGSLQPANGAVDVQINSMLNWIPAVSATSHDLYLGTDKDAVRNATTASPEFKGNKAKGSESYDPGKLDWHSDYYWRIDAVYTTGTVKGLVWNFTTADFLLVDDFESYNDIDPPDPNSNRIFDVWIDGFGTTYNGALVGNNLPPYAEQTTVHGGSQSMPYFYDNNLKTSEATLTLVDPRDWTAEGVMKLSLWFRGGGANSPEKMFVALNGNAVVYHDDSAVTQKIGWNQWVIDLQAFADQGVNLTSVNTITIGIGTKGSPAAGGAGTMYFDDIRLYR